MLTLVRGLLAGLGFVWSFLWRATLYGLIGGAVLGGLYGALLSLGIFFIAGLVVGAILGAVAGLTTGIVTGLALPVLTGLWFRRRPRVRATGYVIAARLLATALSFPIAAGTFLPMFIRPRSGPDTATIVMFSIVPALILASYYWWVGGQLARQHLGIEAAQDTTTWETDSPTAVLNNSIVETIELGLGRRPFN